jgi:flagellar biosynthetic protein FlhB
VERLTMRLDLQMFAGEKTEPATPKKRQEAREKGQVAKSVELPAAFILLFAFLSLIMFGGMMKKIAYQIFESTYHNYLLMNLSMENVIPLFYQLLAQGLIMLAPIFAITVVIAILGNYLQIGFLMTGDPLKMKFSKLNPIEGAKKIFSLRSAVDFLKSIMKMSVIGYVVFSTLWNQKDSIMQLARLPIENAFMFTSSLTISLGIKIGVILIILAVFDFIYQKYEHEKSLKMSKQDIKDEYKKSEGDPLIKAKIREKQRRMALQRMMQDVPKADVVITNPTHFAVALQYDGKNMEAPKVVAKGTDYIAFKIRDVAKQNGIMIMENKPLARALYAQAEIGDSIPADLFQAVAEVLAYVYKVKGKAN